MVGGSITPVALPFGEGGSFATPDEGFSKGARRGRKTRIVVTRETSVRLPPETNSNNAHNVDYVKHSRIFLSDHSPRPLN